MLPASCSATAIRFSPYGKSSCPVVWVRPGVVGFASVGSCGRTGVPVGSTHQQLSGLHAMGFGSRTARQGAPVLTGFRTEQAASGSGLRALPRPIGWVSGTLPHNSSIKPTPLRGAAYFRR